MRPLIAAMLLGAASATAPHAARAWGDEGHEIVALITEHYLRPSVRDKVQAMLSADTDDLTAHDIASEATWADKYRDSDRRTTRERYNETWQWHFVDIELDHSDLDAACFGHPQLPQGTVASRGPAKDCIVDKINEFATELASPATNPEERLVALKFLLHFVGDLHQPLHASDNHDAGGNKVRISAPGFRAGNLHHFWDTEIVALLGTDPQSVAEDLIARISPGQALSWSKGTPEQWANDSFALARDHTYGQLPPPSSPRHYRLTSAYVNDATRVVASQISKAGIRLAVLLNHALAGNR